MNVFGVPEHAGPYVNTTANDFAVPTQGLPKVALFAGMITVDCPNAKPDTTDEDEAA